MISRTTGGSCVAVRGVAQTRHTAAGGYPYMPCIP